MGGFWEIVAIALGSCGFFGVVIGTPLYFVYKKKALDLEKRRMIEEHRTNNLALAYQILSARPEVTMDDVMLLAEQSTKQQLQGPIR